MPDVWWAPCTGVTSSDGFCNPCPGPRKPNASSARSSHRDEARHRIDPAVSQDHSAPPSPSMSSAESDRTTIGATFGRMIAAVAHTCGRRPSMTIAASVVLAVVSLSYTLNTLTFVSSHLKLLPQHERYVTRLAEYHRDFAELSDIIVVIESPHADVSKDYAARLARELRQVGLTERITYRVDPAYFNHRGLLYLSLDDLIKLRDRLFDYQEFIEGYAKQPTLAGCSTS